jgi:hypothetical protein
MLGVFLYDLLHELFESGASAPIVSELGWRRVARQETPAIGRADVSEMSLWRRLNAVAARGFEG